MDYFAQAAAYLQPSLELVAKISSVIPVWMMMVMADKHFLGLPLLEGSVWYSPRIPPRFTIGSGRDGQDASGSTSGQHSAASGPSPLERAVSDSTTHFLPNSQPQGAASTTALTLYQPLEAHDPFVSSSGWLEYGYVASAVLLVVIISFVAMVTNGRWYRNKSNTETAVPKPSAHEQLTEETEFPIRWESILEDLLSNHSDESFEDSLDQPSTPTKSNEDEHVSPLKMIAATAEKADEALVLKDVKASNAENLLEEDEKSDQTETVMKVEKEQENQEEEIPEMHKENGQEVKTKTSEVNAIATGGKPEHCAEVGNANGTKAGKEDLKKASKVDSMEDGPSESSRNVGNEDLDGLEEKTEMNEVVATSTGSKPESCAEAGNENRSEAVKGVGKECSKKGSKVDNKEDGPSESGNNAENENLETSAMAEGIKKKKRRVRQNAKKRAAKLAAADEAGKEVADSSNASLKGSKQREDKDGKPENVDPEVVKPEASDASALAKSQKQDEVAGKKAGDSLNAFLEGPKRRKDKVGKSKEVEPGATDALATAKCQRKDEVTAKDAPTTGKVGSYSLKEADLHDATFVAADTTQKTSLPPRPPTPQTKKPVPVGLPSKPQFTGLPTPKSSGTPQPSPAATANSSPGSDLLSSLITRPKGSVPPLMPHHQSYGAAQSSSNGPSGQLSTPFQNIPGLNIPTTTPTPNHIPSINGAVNPSLGPKPLFGNLTAQGGPKAGTDPHSKNAIFGNGYPSAPILGNLPPGSSSNDAFKLPVFGPSTGFGQSGAGPAKPAPTNQSIFQNITSSSGAFTGFSSPSAGPAETASASQSIFQNISSAGPAKTAPTNQSIFQNVGSSSGAFTGFGSPSAGSETAPASQSISQNMSSTGPAKTAPTSQSVFQNVSVSSGPFTGFGSPSAGAAKTSPPKQSIFQNMPTLSGPSTGLSSSSASCAKTVPTSQSIFQNAFTSSGSFTGFGNPSHGPATTTPTNQSVLQITPPSAKPFTGFSSSSTGPAKMTSTNQSIFQNASISSGQFKGFGSSSTDSAKPAPPAPTSQSIFQNVPVSSGPFTGFINSSAGSAKTAPTNQSIFQNASISSGQFEGFGSPSAATTNPPPAHRGSVYQKIAQPPTPLSLGINQQRGVMPLQNAVTGAMNPAAGNKMEGAKPTAGPGASPFKPRAVPKGRLGLSKRNLRDLGLLQDKGMEPRTGKLVNPCRGLMHGK